MVTEIAFSPIDKNNENPLCFLLQYGLTKTKINPLLYMRMSL